MNKPNSEIFRPDVIPSKRGGLVLIGHNGSMVLIPDSEVEAMIEDMQAVRLRQLQRECAAICRPFQQHVDGEL